MDFPIHRLASRQGIPIYFEEYPSIFKPMTIMICMMSGGADDHAFGVPGLHHWGEHLPFRGTVAYPNGSPQIMGRVAELGGRISAYTSHTHTVFYASAPMSHFREVARIVADLVARPLCRPVDIESERTIIGREISQHNADIDRRSGYLVRRTLWRGHAYGDPIIGTHASLASVGAGAIEEMRSKSYGRSRCVVSVAGSMSVAEVRECLDEMLEVIPDTPLSERRMMGDYGPLPHWDDTDGFEQTELDSTWVALLFPLRDMSRRATYARYLAASMMTVGALASPLMRIVREERNLAYSAATTMLAAGCSAAIGLSAKTNADKVQDVIQAFRDVLASKNSRSPERWEYVRNALQARFDMDLPDPAASARHNLNQVVTYGDAMTDSDAFALQMSVPYEEIVSILDEYASTRGRVVTLQGK